MKSLFTKEQCQFLVENYPKYGYEFCADKLNIPIKQVTLKIKKLQNKLHFKLNPAVLSERLSKTRHIKTIDEYAVDVTQFTDIKSPEIAYILGLLWADGYVYVNKSQNKISIEMIQKDMESIKKTFFKCGRWNIYYRHRKNRKPQMSISTNNKLLSHFLLKNDYNTKSNASADKILSLIPDNLKHYWFRGLADGDGCFYLNKKNKCYQFTVASSYDQDWNYIENIFKKMNISYKIKKREQFQNKKINKSSYVRISNKNDIKKFGDYIYNGIPMGLKRKYKKYSSILMMI